MRLSTRIRPLLLLLAILATTYAAPTPAPAQVTQTAATPAATLPSQLSDTEFWNLVTQISEPGGYFRMADNFVSNERDIGAIAGAIRANGPSGGVYMGVGPEQNLTYIAAVRPQMVFIVDIRRQAVMHHLLYKAIFELSRDRADFISLLFAKPRPVGLDSNQTIFQIWEGFLGVPMDSAMASATLVRLRDHLTKTHGFPLTPEEIDMFDHVYRSFTTYGPGITTNGPNRGLTLITPANPSDTGTIARVRAAAQAALYGGSPGSPGTAGVVNFVFLSTVTNVAGEPNSFLGSEESFRFIKDLHTRNLFVPNSGNFGGPKAIRAVGQYARERGAVVSAFYVSNVESYLFGDGIADEFYDNVATLPVDERSVIIRPGGQRYGMALCPIASFIRAAAAGQVTSNSMALRCPR